MLLIKYIYIREKIYYWLKYIYIREKNTIVINGKNFTNDLNIEYFSNI